MLGFFPFNDRFILLSALFVFFRGPFNFGIQVEQEPTEGTESLTEKNDRLQDREIHRLPGVSVNF